MRSIAPLLAAALLAPTQVAHAAAPALLTTVNLPSSMSVSFADPLSHGIGVNPVAGEILYSQPGSVYTFRTDLNGNYLGSVSQGSPGGAGWFSTDVSSDGTSYYKADFYTNANGPDMYISPISVVSWTQFGTEKAASMGYPLEVRGTTLYRAFSHTTDNRIRVGDVSAPDVVSSTLTLSGVVGGIEDFTVDVGRGVIYVLEYRGGANVLKFSLTSGALLETWALNLDGRDGGITYHNNRLYYYDHVPNSGSTLRIYNLELVDTDNDGVVDDADNCPTISNYPQTNSDSDAAGDACDTDDDNDTVADTSDNCPVNANTTQGNNDNDAQGDVCDTDDDNDTVADASDNCGLTANADQADNDTDRVGDLCDSDDDNDLTADGADCAPFDRDIHPSAAELCDEVDNDCDGWVDDNAIDTQAFFKDADQDGHGTAVIVRACDAGAGLSSVADDCNDAAATVYPGATEVCDDVDSDCDGDLVDGEANFDGDTTPDCIDADDDNDGSADTEDCDDADAAVHPGATETCNQVDDNCDGLVDNSPVDGQVYAVDADLDGFGDAEMTARACALADGFADNADDCDDGDELTAPDAPEVPGDGIDNDCNGLADDDGDRDDDGISDDDEDALGTDADDADTDGDGVSDGFEIGSDLEDPVDTDGDGVIDALDADDDGDGLVTEAELGDWDGSSDPAPDADGDGIPDHLDTDSDNDGIGDASEGAGDDDGDGIPNATDSDADGDGVNADTDCNDRDPSSFPGATEFCDGIDNDCDATVDNDCLGGEDTDVDTDTGGIVDDQGGCRCDNGTSGANFLWAALLPLLALRRRSSR